MKRVLLFFFCFPAIIIPETGNIACFSGKIVVRHKPLAGDVVFNEIFFDPEPVAGLPGYEYIELVNRSEYPVSMKGWMLLMGGKMKVLEDAELDPGEFLLICYQGTKDLYRKAIHAMDILSSKTSLSNKGALIQLLDPDSNLIDWIEYEVGMHSDKYYADGGWSLERIDPNRKCFSTDNWSTSTSRMGGTPGRINSILGSNPDLDPPQLNSVYINDSGNLVLEFNESLDPNTSVYKRNWHSSGGIGYPDSVCLLEPQNRVLRISYLKSFSPGVDYLLDPGPEIKDCSGNRFRYPYKIRFAVPVLPAMYEILISEVLFNPLPFCPDFIEIYNPTRKTFDIKDLCLATRDSENGELISAGRITENHLLFFPGEYLALTGDIEELLAFFSVHDPATLLKVRNLPAMDDVEGRVVLLDRYLDVIDEMEYHKDMHHPSLPSIEGVTLERISFTSESGKQANWHSASSMEGYGTPGRENSQRIQSDHKATGIVVEPEIFSPNMDGVDDFLYIRYKFPSPGCRVKIVIADPRGRIIREVVTGDLLGTEGFYTWDGTDTYGSQAGKGIYMVLTIVSGVDGKVRKYRDTCVLSTCL